MAESEVRARAQKRVGALLRGKYRLEELLGFGGMASVYRATHRNGNRVAIKMLHLQYSLDEEMRQRFVREGYVANGVDHKGVVKVIDDDVAEDGSVFVVMELLEGETVHARWERSGHRMPVPEVVRIGVDLLDVLTAAHARTIVHRDIKPENLFITNEGAFKVLDFGIARWKDGFTDGSLTQTGLTLGTPQFMSPEQALGKRDLIDGRSDVWAVGATLFALLAGRYVHEGETVQEVSIHAATKDPVPLRSVAPHVPEGVAAVVDRALLRSRDARWPSALAMKRALEEVWSRMDRRPITSVSLALPTHNPEHETTIEGESSVTSSDEATRELPLPTRGAEVEAATGYLPLPAAAKAAPIAVPAQPVTEAAISSDPPTQPQPRARGKMIAVVALVLVGVAVAIAYPLLTRSVGDKEPARQPPTSESSMAEPKTNATEPIATTSSSTVGQASSGSVAPIASASIPTAKSTKPSKPLGTKAPPVGGAKKDIFAP